MKLLAPFMIQKVATPGGTGGCGSQSPSPKTDRAAVLAGPCCYLSTRRSISRRLCGVCNSHSKHKGPPHCFLI